VTRGTDGLGPNRIRVARASAGLTQAQLAEAVGVSRQTVVAMEAGNYAPSVYLALRVAATLGTTVEDLFVVAEPAGARELLRRSGRP
jgi:putative transcriptional regulator